MGLKRSFVLLSALGIVASLFMIGIVFLVCGEITAKYPHGSVIITGEGVVEELESPTKEQMRVINIVDGIELLSCILVPVCCLVAASLLFYRYKLKEPITILQQGTERIRQHDLDFSIPKVSGDELGQVCDAFETMRAELLQTNQELWRQTEERKRLNAAFSHDLRNPLTVLKGTVKLLRQETADEHALQRMETYILRLEQYVEAMSSVQRLEQLPVQKKEVQMSMLRDELEETAKLINPNVESEVCIGARDILCGENGSRASHIDTEEHSEGIVLDHGLFLTVAENLIGNAVRHAKKKIEVYISVCEKDIGHTKTYLNLSVTDDGDGYPVKLIQDGPKPFGKMEEEAEHFGMGLYTSRMLCMKHGGTLLLENDINGGARATASFSVEYHIS